MTGLATTEAFQHFMSLCTLRGPAKRYTSVSGILYILKNILPTFFRFTSRTRHGQSAARMNIMFFQTLLLWRSRIGGTGEQTVFVFDYILHCIAFPPLLYKKSPISFHHTPITLLKCASSVKSLYLFRSPPFLWPLHSFNLDVLEFTSLVLTAVMHAARDCLVLLEYLLGNVCPCQVYVVLQELSAVQCFPLIPVAAVSLALDMLALANDFSM
ncbi:MAG: hypothetical protein NXY57DRAFT_1029744 [Lentinula lateritia]|nr:MAG: hypothetical protein NXY57DRAFT_1029744 [Lentinula lateritia]